ncbi:MAG TPA: LytTR family DNA-binding domain-containing protein [Mucilaginibacter sp.]|nr:LytTR family DNA-binding domain-containing protein [Mucilaginibacter sp.]
MTLRWSLAKKLLHLLLWVIITAIFLYDRRYLILKAGLGHFAECTIVRLVLIISLCYFHIFYLIPKYFATRKFTAYFALLLVSICIYVGLQSLYDLYLYGVVLSWTTYRSFWASVPFNLLTTAWYLAVTVAFKLSLDWYQQRAELGQLQDELRKNAAIVIADHSETDHIFLKSGTRKIKTSLASIYYIQGLKDYSIIYTNEGKIIVKGSLKIVEELFPPKHFVRTHKSYMVASNKIKHLQGNKLVLINNEVIPIGRSYKHLLAAG